MRYYVCNTPDPLEVPWGGGAKFYATDSEARAEAITRATSEPGTVHYVHAFPESTAIFKAEGRVELNTEYIHADSE